MSNSNITADSVLLVQRGLDVRCGPISLVVGHRCTPSEVSYLERLYRGEGGVVKTMASTCGRTVQLVFNPGSCFGMVANSLFVPNERRL
jgi:hypothetical protein